MRAAAADWMLEPAYHEAGQDAVDRRELDLALRLAHVLLTPTAHVHPDRLALRPFEADAVAAMARHPAFARPVETVVAERLGLGDIAPGRPFLTRLATSASARLAVLLVTQPLADASRLAVQVAAAVLSRRVVGLILKRDREVARAALGEEAFAFAVQEAPLLHPPLADLDAGAANGLTAELAEPAAAETFGRLVVRRFLEIEDPALPRLHDLAAAPDRPAIAHDAVRAFHAPQVEHLVRLVRRRQPAWSAIIG